MRHRLLFWLLTVAFAAYGQRTIEGEVRLVNDSSALPGVNVVEKGSGNAVASNGDGKFTITCRTASPTLMFSFIGLKTVEYAAGAEYLIVYLEEDEEVLNEKIRWGIYPEYTSIGFNSGLNYSPIGLNLRNALPVLFGVKVLTTTDLTYRTDLDKNKFFNAKFQKDRLIDFSYYSRYINLIAIYNYRNISNDHDTWKAKTLTLSAELHFDSFGFLLGYGRQSFNDTETLKSNEAIVFGFGKYFDWHVSIKGTAAKWNGYWQSDLQFAKGFSNNNFELGIRFETLQRYRELDLLVLYRIHY